MLLLLPLLLSGCAYQKAIDSGALYESQGDIEAALDAYRLALAERPGDPTATAAEARLLEEKEDQAVQRAEEALARADYEAVLDALEDVGELDDDRPEVFVLTQKAKEELRAGFLGMLAAKRHEDAYGIAVRTRDLFGNQAYLNKGFLDLRAHYTQTARAHFLTGKHEAALAALDTLERFEPDQAAAVAAQRHSIQTGWADEFVRQARLHERANRPGPAAMSYLRAFEAARRPIDGQAVDRLLGRLKEEGALGFHVTTVSRAPRDLALLEAIGKQLDGHTPTRPAKPAHLTVTVTPSPWQCAEAATRKKKTSNFVAGTVAVPNPPYADLSRRIDEAKRSAKGATRKADLLWTIVSELSTRLQEREGELVAMMTQRPVLQASVDEALLQRDRAAALGATSLGEWETALADRQAALQALLAQLEPLEAERVPLQAEVQTAEADHNAARAEAEAANRAVASLEAERAGHPPTVDRDVADTFHWDLEKWTRTCEAELSVRVRAAWPSQLPDHRTVRDEEATEDEAHVGNASAKLEEDPLEYPLTDEEMLQRIDERNAAQMADWMGQLVDEHYEKRVAAAVVAWHTDSTNATTEALRLLLGAPDRLEQPAVELLTGRLEETWGVLPVQIGGKAPASAE